MSAIKIVLVLALFGLLLVAFRNRARVGLRAGARVAVLLVLGLGVASVIDPDITQWAADRLGVTRGTDLVLYALVVIFGLTSAGFFFRFRDLERRMVDVVRAQSISAAVSAQGVPGTRGGDAPGPQRSTGSSTGSDHDVPRASGPPDSLG